MSLQDVTPEKVFWLQGGKPIKNIPELARELKRMSPETFAHHVTEHKNDFANWIEECAKDEKLAALVKTTRAQHRMAAIIERRIQELTQPQKERPKPEIIQPTIIRTKNTTPLNIKQELQIIKTPNVTQLTLAKKEEIIRTGKTTRLLIKEPREIIETPHKTPLTLGHHKEIYVHEVKTHHHSATLLISHLVLGIVIGVAITALIIMLI